MATKMLLRQHAKEDVALQEELMSILLRLLDDEKIAWTQQQKFLSKSTNSNIIKEIKNCVASKNCVKAFQENECITNFLAKVKQCHVRQVPVTRSEVGNAKEFNQNAKSLMMLKSKEGEDDFFQCASQMLFGSSRGDVVLKLAVANEVIKAQNEFKKMCTTFGATVQQVKENLVNQPNCPHPVTVAFFGRALQKNIFIHLGSRKNNKETFAFANKFYKKNMHMIVMNGTFHALIETESSISFQAVNGLAPRKVSSTKPMLESSPFYDVATALLTKCQFCQYYSIQNCEHVTQSHVLAKNQLASLSKKFDITGNLASCFQESHYDNPRTLPKNLKNCKCIKVDRDGDCFYSSISIFLTGSVDMAKALRKAIMAEFIDNEVLYRQWYCDCDGEKKFKDFRERILSPTAWANNDIITVMSKLVDTPIVLFTAASEEPGFIHSFAKTTFTKPPYCISHIDNNHFQPLIPNDYSNFNVERVNDEYLSSRAKYFCPDELARSRARCKIQNGVIKYVGRVKKSSKASIKEPTKYFESDLALVLKKKHFKILELLRPKQKAVEKILLERPSNVSKYHAEMFLDIIKNEITRPLKFSESGIAKFIHRTSFAAKFWVPNISTRKGPGEKLKKAYALRKIHESNYGQALVAALLQDAGQSKRVIEIYQQKVRQEFHNPSHKATVTTMRVDGQNRKYPEYDSLDFDNETPPVAEQTSEEQPRTVVHTESPASCHAESFSNFHEREAAKHLHPENEKTETSDENSSRTVSVTSEQAQAPSDIVEKEDIANALGVKTTPKHLSDKPFEIQILSKEMDNIFDFKTLRFRTRQAHSIGSTDLISNLISGQIPCSFSLRREIKYYAKRNLSKYGFCKMNGYCKCNRFFDVIVLKQPVRGEDLTAKVNPKGDSDLVQTRATNRQLRAGARQKVLKRLQHEMPRQFLLKETAKLSPAKLLHGNRTASIHSLRTLRSQFNKQDQNSNVLAEELEFIRKQQIQESDNEKIKGFIQRLNCEPDSLSIYLYDEGGLKLLTNYGRHNELRLHVDATGSVCLKPSQKEVLYFLVLASTKNMTFPVAHLLTQRSRDFDLEQFFIKLKSDIKEVKPSFKKALAPVIVTDMSLPLLHGVCRGLNDMRLNEYLSLCWDVINGKKSFEIDRSILSVCTNHLIKAFSNRVSKYVTSSKTDRTKKFYAVKSLAKLQECETIQEIAMVYKVIAEFFSAEHMDPAKVDMYKDYIASSISDMLIDEHDNALTNEDFKADIEQIDDSGIKFRESSPFRKLFCMIEHNVRQGPKYEKNVLANENILGLFRDQYVPITPLFVSATLNVTGRSPKNRSSNAVIESEFNIIKKNMHGGKRQKLDSFIKIQYLYHKGKLNSLLVEDTKDIRRSPRVLSSRKKPLEETWQRRRPKRGTKYVRAAKVIDNTPKSFIDDILQKEIFTLSSDVLLKNITEKQSFQKQKSLSPPNKFNAKRGRRRPKPSTKRQNIPDDDIPDRQQVVREYEETMQLMDKFQVKLNNHLQERPHRKRELQEKVAEIENDFLTYGTNKNKPQVIDRVDSSKTNTQQKKASPILEEVVRPNAAQTIRSEGGNLSIFCRITSDLPVLDTILTKDNMAEFVNPRVWIDGTHVDFYLAYLKDQNPDSKYMVSTHSFALRYSLSSHAAPMWSVIETETDIVDGDGNKISESETEKQRRYLLPINYQQKCIDYSRYQHIIHPLLDDNHWCLLVMDFEKKVCTVIDSLCPKSENVRTEKLADYQFNVLPRFLPKHQQRQVRSWEIKYCLSMKQQGDAYSCGILAMAAARELLLSSNESSIDDVVMNIGKPEAERHRISLEVLSTTEEGRQLLTDCKYNPREVAKYFLGRRSDVEILTSKQT